MTVTNVTATIPLTSTGGTNPNVALTTPLGAAYGGTGQVHSSLILGWYNVKDYGAVGDGITDDSASINSALNLALANNGCLYFPAGNYYYNSATPININSTSILNFSIFCTGNAIIIGGPASTNCFVISGQAISNGASSSPWTLPSIKNFTNGAGITCTDTPASVFLGTETHISLIENCKDGILITSGAIGSGVGVFGPWFVFDTISTCVNGIRFQSRFSSRDSMQGSQLVGGIIYNCTNGVVFDGQACATTAPFTIPAIGGTVSISVNRGQFQNGDPIVVGLAGNLPAFIGSVISGAGTATMTVKVANFIPSSSSYAGQLMPSNIGVNGFYNSYSSVNSINCAINGIGVGQSGIVILGGVWTQVMMNAGTSFFGFGQGGTGSTTLSGYYGQFWNSSLTANWLYAPFVTYGCMAAYSSPTPNYNNGNIFVSSYSSLAPDTYPANSSFNSRSSFNGGVPIVFPSFRLKFALPAMTVGQLVDFYAYSWFTTGGPSSVRFTTNNFSGAPIVVQCCEDESGTVGSSGHVYPNEIHIRLLAIGTVVAGSSIFGRLDVGV